MVRGAAKQGDTMMMNDDSDLLPKKSHPEDDSDFENFRITEGLIDFHALLC